jgi:DNA-binding response OmpR family regulator
MAGDAKPPVVLIADDDPKILNLLSIRLSRRGYQVLEAVDGAQTLEQARKHHPDVVLLDVMMPGKSGWETAKELRADEALRDIGIVIMTALGEKVSKMTSLIYGADACIDKPFDFDELDAQLQRLIKR